MKPVPRREKKVSNFMDILKAENKVSRKQASSSSATKARPTSAPTAIAALRSRKKQEMSAQTKGPEVVKSSFAPPVVLPELGPTTSEAELNDLLDQMEKEIAIDPELTQDLLDILNDEDEEMMEDDDEMEGAIGYTGPPITAEDLDDPMLLEESEFYSEAAEDTKEFSGDIEDDPEMAEMLLMLEAAKGDLEGAGEEDLETLMSSFDNEMLNKAAAAAGVKRKSDKDQVVPESTSANDEQDASSKKAKISEFLRPVPAFIGEFFSKIS